MFRFPVEWQGLAYPHVRVALTDYLDEIADPSRTASWRELGPGEGQNGARQLLFFLFDAHDFGPAAIGLSLLDAEEAALIAALKRLLVEIDVDSSDRSSSRFLDHPLWPAVIAAGAAARDALVARGRALWVEEG